MPSWVRWQTPEREKYANIETLVAQSDVPIYQFEAARLEIDFHNLKVMEKIPHVRVFAMDNAIHGGPIDAACLGVIVNKTSKQLDELYQRFQGRLISNWQMNLAVLSFSEIFKLYYKKICKNGFKVKFTKREKLVVLFGITFYKS